MPALIARRTASFDVFATWSSITVLDVAPIGDHEPVEPELALENVRLSVRS
jgi:hypothetical protein